MQNKILTLLLLIFVTISLSVNTYAAEPIVSDRGLIVLEDSYDISEFTDSMKDEFGLSVQIMSARVENDSVGLEDFLTENICYYNSVQMNSDDGSFKIEYKIPPYTSKFCLVVYNPYLGAKYYYFDYESKIYFDFSDAKSAGISQMIAYTEQYKNFIEWNVVAYEALSEQKEAINTLLLSADDPLSQSELNKIYQALPLEEYVFDIEDNSKIHNYIINSDTNPYSSCYGYFRGIYATKLSEECQEQLCTYMKDYQNTDYKNAFDNKVLSLYVQNMEYFAQISEIIEDDENPLSIPETVYSKYTKLDNKNSVLQNIYEQKASIESIDKFNELFASYVSEQEYAEKSSASSGSSSKRPSGGGGGGGSISLPITTLDKPLNTDVEEVVEQPQKDDIQTFVDLDNYEWAKDAIYALKSEGIINGVSEKEFNPSDTVKREEFVKMITTMLRLTGVDAEANFKDVSDGDWFYPYIAAAVRANLINGYSDGTFGIGKEVTRQDMAVIIERAIIYKNINLSGESMQGFNDDSLVSDYAKYSIYALYSAGILNGTGNNSFSPLKAMTRAEAAMVVYNTLNYIKGEE